MTLIKVITLIAVFIGVYYCVEPTEIEPRKTLSERLPSEPFMQKPSMTPGPASLSSPTLDQLLKLFNNTDTPPHNFLPVASINHRPLSSLPKCYQKRKHAVDLTMYWIPKEGEWDEADNGKRVLLEDTASRVPLLDPNDHVVANVSYPLWKKCRMEGTCLLANGDLINLAPGYTNRFILIGQKNRRQNIFGWGAGLQNLQPYVSVAANDLALNQTFFVRELNGLRLGNGQIHNGCVRVDDDGWSFGGCQMDLFVVSYVDYLWLYRELDVDRISVVPRNCTLLNYSTKEHLVYMDAESRNETLQLVMNDTLTLMDQTVAVYQNRSEGPF